MKPSVAVIGFGRFGALWASILRRDLDVAVYDTSVEACDRARQAGFAVEPLPEILQRDTIFYVVPISSLRSVLEEHVKILKECRPGKLLVDVLSVKTYPKEVFGEVLPRGTRVLLTHPLFGPDSVGGASITGHRIVVDKYSATVDEHFWWSRYFQDKGLEVIEMTADEHDRYAAESQGLTHAIGRTLEEYGLASTPIDTLGARKLMEVKNQVCNDTWALFRDLQTFNPYTASMRWRLGRAQNAICRGLLPERMVRDRLMIGIQGGRGSFNDEALRERLAGIGDPVHECKYLYTTKAVLSALEQGEIDIGQFAICNSSGGVVRESVEAMGEHNFKVVAEFSAPIFHTLIIRSDASEDSIDTIMAHPQALRQCEMTLKRDYSDCFLVHCEGPVADASGAAPQLSSGQIPSSVAILGSKELASLPGLKILKENLQDSFENRTTFLWVSR